MNVSWFSTAIFINITHYSIDINKNNKIKERVKKEIEIKREIIS